MRTNAFQTAGQFAGEFAGNVQLGANLNLNKTFSITGTGQIETDYILRLNLLKSVEPSIKSNRDVYCDNKVRNDFNDVRFKSESGENLEYYKHSYDNFELQYGDSSGDKIILANGDILTRMYSTQLHISEDGGLTWTLIYNDSESITLTYVDSNGYIYIQKNNLLLRSTDEGVTFATVHDMTSTSSFIITSAFSEDTYGNLYIGEYQLANGARILKSTDNGATWVNIYNEVAEQHVHSISVDPYTDYVYAGIDGSDPTIIRSVDSGNVWTHIRNGSGSDVTSIQFGSGYRLFGNGESGGSIGIGIFKTTDDVNYSYVLQCGSPIKDIKRYGSSIYAFAPSSDKNRYPQIYKSSDDGETWKTIKILDYHESNLTGYDRSVSDYGTPKGLTDILLYSNEDEIKNTILYDGGNHYQSLIYVKIPLLPADGMNIIVSTGNENNNVSTDVFDNALPSGLAGRWKINEGIGTSIIDSSGNNNDGVLTVVSGEWKEYGISKVGELYPYIKKFNNSFRFNGVDNEVLTIPYSANIALSYSFSFVAWVTNESEVASGWIIDHLTTTNGWAVYIGGTNHALALCYSNGTTRRYKPSSPASSIRGIAPFIPRMVGFRIDATGTKITWFNDGKFSSEQTLDNAIIPCLEDIYIGNYRILAAGGGYEGGIQDVQLYDKYLSDNEFRSLFECRPMADIEAVIG